MNATEISGDKVLHLVVPAKPEYLSLVRLVVASIAGDSGFSDENIGDIKVALSEASTNVVRHAYPPDAEDDAMLIEINCYEDTEHLLIEVRDQGRGMPLPPPASEGLGLGIMGSLMDSVEVETGKTGTSVLMAKSPTSGRRTVAS